MALRWWLKKRQWLKLLKRQSAKESWVSWGCERQFPSSLLVCKCRRTCTRRHLARDCEAPGPFTSRWGNGVWTEVLCVTLGLGFKKMYMQLPSYFSFLWTETEKCLWRTFYPWHKGTNLQQKQERSYTSWTTTWEELHFLIYWFVGFFVIQLRFSCY